MLYCHLKPSSILTLAQQAPPQFPSKKKKCKRGHNTKKNKAATCRIRHELKDAESKHAKDKAELVHVRSLLGHTTRTDNIAATEDAAQTSRDFGWESADDEDEYVRLGADAEIHVYFFLCWLK